ncbi:hypothetical protein NEMIN01_0380 [Nematocida minor]|uniref:uncharacterized protein n=1 Tax=Nematocida minor TaxID=1912983 RepID=UPI00221FB7A8|nr:uncharacterized protein NEMIN01_0380 [Nematocida minor]KAI5189214.1 hypothetical protein NEMIN01_0380 [Nematocida minor]
MLLKRKIMEIGIVVALLMSYIETGSCKVKIEDAVDVLAIFKRDLTTEEHFEELLSRVSCNLTMDDIKGIHADFSRRLDYLREEFELRVEFYEKFISIIQPMLERYKIGYNEEIKLKEMEENIMPKLIRKRQKLARYTSYLTGIEDLIIRTRRPIPRGIRRFKKSLKLAFLCYNNAFDSLSEMMYQFDSAMIDLIEEYMKIANENNILSTLPLFKIAKNKKILAADIIYTFFSVSKEDFSNEDICYRMLKRTRHIPVAKIKKLVSSIKEDVLKHEIDSLASANKNFLVLLHSWHDCKPDLQNEEVLSVYLDLIEKYLSKKEGDIYTYKLTDDQVIKIVMIEYLLNKCAIKYKNNMLFFNLNQIIEKIGRPINIGKDADIHQSLKTAIKKQDMMIDALCFLWTDYDSITIDKKRNIDSFCEEFNVNFFSLQRTQKELRTFKWLFKLNEDIVEIGGLAIQNIFPKLNSRFDISHIHPMWYLYFRAEYINSHINKDTQVDSNSFMKKTSKGTTIRPYKINEKDSPSTHQENLKNCIKVWFLDKVRVVSICRSVEETYDIASDFADFLPNSVQIKEERKREIGETAGCSRSEEGNPLIKICE